MQSSKSINGFGWALSQSDKSGSDLEHSLAFLVWTNQVLDKHSLLYWF